MARQIDARVDALFVEGPDDGAVVNALIRKHTGIDLTTKPRLVRSDLSGGGAEWVPQSAALAFARDASRLAKEVHGAEYEIEHERKAALKVRSVWRDASAAGGYGHLVRNLKLKQTPASASFVTWFKELFLT